jgi:predicted flap endonuclease-1-like 5' DNA nuclease
MKKAYWFIFAFLIWCAACSLWYLYSVNGIVGSDQNHFSATHRLVAIAEILFMMLGACLLGFTIAWQLKAEEISAKDMGMQQLLTENEALIDIKENLGSQLQQLKGKQSAEASSLKLKIAQLSHEREELQKKLEGEETSFQKLKVESGERKWMLEQKNQQEETLMSQIHELESVRKSLEQTNLQLKEEIRQLQSINGDKTTHHLLVRPAVNDHKDDLTKIKGIGPFIEKRLNMLGIYSFQQLSELDSEMVDRVGAAIEFFPGRIARENWIGQAKKLCDKYKSV